MTEGDRAHYGLGLGDLLVVRVNGSPAIAGRVISYAGPGGFAYCDHFIRYRLSHEVDPRFIAFQFRHRPVRSQVEAGMVSTAGQHTVSQRTFAAISVTVPPLAEQHRIVAEIETQFTRLDAAVATLERVKVKLKRARASVLKAAVEGRLVPTEAYLARSQDRTYEPASVLLARVLVERKARWPKGKKYVEPVKPNIEGLAELPEGWAGTSLEHIGTWTSGGTPSRSRPDFFGGHIPWVKTGELLDRDIHQAEEHITDEAVAASAAKLFPKGTLLLAMYGATIGMTGRLRIEAATNQACAALLPSPENDSLFPFIWVYLLSQREAFRNIGQGGAQPNISQGIVKAWPLPLPPLSEQIRIVAEVDRRLSVLDALDTTIEQNLAKCARLRQSILKRAFEGKLVPQEPERPSVDAEAGRANVAVPRPPS